MPRISVRLAPVLAALADGTPTVELDLGDEATVRGVLAILAERFPAVSRRIQDEQGEVRRHVNVFVGSHNIRDLAGIETRVDETSEVVILPAVSGG